MGDINSGVVGQQQRPNPADADTGVNRAQMISGFTDPRLQALMQSLFPQFQNSANVLAPVQPGPSGGVQLAPQPGQGQGQGNPGGGVPGLSTAPAASSAPGVGLGGGAPLAGANPFAALLAANPIAGPAALTSGAPAPANPAAAAINPAATNVAIDPTAAFIMSLFGQGERGTGGGPADIASQGDRPGAGGAETAGVGGSSNAGVGGG